MDTSFKNIFYFERTPDDCFLCLSMNFERFPEHFFYRASPGNCYCMSKLQNSTKYSKKLLHTGSFQAFCTRSRSSHSKVFIYLRSLKTKKKLSCNEVARCHPVILRKKHFHTSSYFLPSFSQNASRLLLSKRL